MNDKLVLVYPPFCTPASPPYSVTGFYSKLKDSSLDVSVLDLNVEFHNLFFSHYRDYFKKKDWVDYDSVSKKCGEEFDKCYALNNKLVLQGNNPQGFQELLNLILEKKPSIVAFSIVYSSQVFYAFALIKELKKLNIKTIVGGLAVSNRLRQESLYLADLDALSNYLQIGVVHDAVLDFSIYDEAKYFSPELVLPLKTSSTCYYKQCAFCSHFSRDKYFEVSVDLIEEIVSGNSANHYFLIDDMISSKRLLSLAKVFKKHNVSWACQLKPTRDFTKEVLQELKDSGLVFVMWGVESGSNKVLKAMFKGTNKEDVALVLKNSKESGVINNVYIMFGFPSETKDDFDETISFLKDNEANIDLVLSSVFGLQRGTKVYNEPAKFNVVKIFEEERTLLDPKVSYDVCSSLSNRDASLLRKKHLKFLGTINKLPKKTNFFREHTFFY